ncbi:MAG: helix-turn-helix transcriptional regulator [Chloroflexi bacterium]|nr:helix-turn-helix transcriptional regulator [Chloroflexota bacterium]MCI0815855.1 helix-turn-helix transcriptional regulator [Chloroflexota bacterium]
MTELSLSNANRHTVRASPAERIAEGRRRARAPSEYAHAAEIYRALGDPTRVKIIDELLHQELCTSDLAEIVGISEPAVSQHLRLLRAQRVVTSHRHGQRVFYALDDDHVRDLLSLTLAHVRDHAEARAAG